MSNLLRRIKRPRRTPAADPARGSAASESADAPLETSPGVGGPLLAGEDLDDRRPTTLRRGRLRKRLRFLERERELLLRDLGGLVYEIHRTGTPADREHHRALVADKVARLAGLDAELESGLVALGEARGDTVLREPGIGGLCPRCGEIHGSDAHFCSACGFPLELTGTPGAAAGHSPPAVAGDAVVQAPRAAGVPDAPVIRVGVVPAAGRSGADPVADSPHPPAIPATAADAATPPPGAEAEAAVPAVDDAPTRIVTRRSPTTPEADGTGEPPPSEPQSR